MDLSTEFVVLTLCCTRYFESHPLYAHHFVGMYVYVPRHLRRYLFRKVSSVSCKICLLREKIRTSFVFKRRVVKLFTYVWPGFVFYLRKNCLYYFFIWDGRAGTNILDLNVLTMFVQTHFSLYKIRRGDSYDLV